MADFLKKKFVGLDLSDRNIEAVEIEKEGRNISVKNTSRIRIDPGIIENGAVKDKMKLRKAVEELFKKAKPSPIYCHEVYFSLPERQTRVKMLSIKKPKNWNKGIKRGELNKIAREEAERMLSIEKNNISFSYSITNESEKEVEIILVTAYKNVIFEWHDFFEILEVDVDFCDIEVLATFRGLSDADRDSKNKNAIICLADIGSETTNISVFVGGVLAYVYSSDIAGDDLDRQISSDLSLDIKDAEFQKMKLGLLDKNGQVYHSLDRILSVLREEIKNTISRFEDTHQKNVDKLILIGKSSTLKGFMEYLRESIKTPLSLGRPQLLQRYVPVEYIEAVGLAVRAFQKKWNKVNPILKIEDRGSRTGSSKNYDEHRKIKIFLKNLAFAFSFLICVSFVLYFFEWHEGKEHEKENEAGLELEGELVKEDALASIGEKNIIEEKEAIIETEEYVLIEDTPTGWLNVREGPGINFKQIKRVDVGDKYIFLEDKDDWYKIQIDDELEGWVYSEYATTTKENVSLFGNDTI